MAIGNPDMVIRQDGTRNARAEVSPAALQPAAFSGLPIAVMNFDQLFAGRDRCYSASRARSSASAASIATAIPIGLRCYASQGRSERLARNVEYRPRPSPSPSRAIAPVEIFDQVWESERRNDHPGRRRVLRIGIVAQASLPTPASPCFDERRSPSRRSLTAGDSAREAISDSDDAARTSRVLIEGAVRLRG